MRYLVTAAIMILCHCGNNSIAQSYTSQVKEYIIDSAKTTVFKNVKIIDGTGGASK